MSETDTATIRCMKIERDIRKRKHQERAREEIDAQLARFAAGRISPIGEVIDAISRKHNLLIEDDRRLYDARIAEEQERQQPGSRLLAAR